MQLEGIFAFSAAIRRGLIEAGNRGAALFLAGVFSAAIRRALIEA